MSSLSESFGQLSNLEKLDLACWCKPQILPTSIGGLTKSRFLGISNSGVEELIEKTGKLQSLVVFKAMRCLTLSKLPKSFGQLPNVKRLDLCSLWQASNLTYIYWWADKVESSKHIQLTNGRTSRGFWWTTKCCRLQCKWWFILVKVTGIIWLVAKPGKTGPRLLWRASNPTYIYWWAYEVENSRYIKLYSGKFLEIFGELQSLVFFKSSQCLSLSRLPKSFGQLLNVMRLDLANLQGYLHFLVGSQSWECRHIGLRSGRTFQRILGKYSHHRLQCEWLFVPVMVTIIIWRVAKRGNNAPFFCFGHLQRLPTSIGGLKSWHSWMHSFQKRKNSQRVSGNYKAF